MNQVSKSDYFTIGMAAIYGCVKWFVENPDVALTRSIGVVTLIFGILKTAHLIKHWDKKKED